MFVFLCPLLLLSEIQFQASPSPEPFLFKVFKFPSFLRTLDRLFSSTFSLFSLCLPPLLLFELGNYASLFVILVMLHVLRRFQRFVIIINLLFIDLFYFVLLGF